MKKILLLLLLSPILSFGQISVNKTDTTLNIPIGSNLIKFKSKDWVQATTIPLSQKGAANGVAVLGPDGKVPSSELNITGGLTYKGSWDAASNSPVLTNGVGTNGDLYKVDTAGTHDFGAGSITFEVGDHVIYLGGSDNKWEKFGASEAVASVNGHTGIVVLNKSDVGLANVDNTSDLNKPISTATQGALNLKANIASPTFTGTVGGITKAMVGLGNVDNTSDANKPVSTATQAALDLKVTTPTPLIAGVVLGTTISTNVLGMVGYSQTPEGDKLAMYNFGGQLSTAAPVDDTDAATKKYVDDHITGLPASVESVNTRTGAVVLTKADVGLTNADNTSDVNKPVSTAQANALALKAPLASPALTGVPTAPTASTATSNTQLATTAFTHAVAGSLAVGSANPTASAGLAAVNGVAPTFMRSDAAPALSQAITPTWTGEHIFGKASTALIPSVGITNTNPQLDWNVVGGAVDNKRWNIAATGALWSFRALNDAGVASNAWTVTRAAGAVSKHDWYAGGTDIMSLATTGLTVLPPQTIVTSTDGYKLWLAKYITGSGHSNAPTAIGAPSTYLNIGGREYGNGGYGGIGFSYVGTPADHPAVWLGWQERNTAGSTNGDLVIATRSATTNTAPLERLRITNLGAWALGGLANTGTAGQVITSTGAGTPPTWQTPAGGGGDASVQTMVLTTDQNFTSMSPAGVADFSQIVLTDNKTEVRLIEAEIYMSGAHEAGLQFYFTNINMGTITFNGSAIIPPNAGSNALYTPYDTTNGIQVDPADALIQKVTLSLYVTSTPTGGSYGSLLFAGRQQTSFGSPVTIHAGSKITSRLISSN